MFLRPWLIVLTGITEWMKTQYGHYQPGSYARNQWRRENQDWDAAAEVPDWYKGDVDSKLAAALFLVIIGRSVHLAIC